MGRIALASVLYYNTGARWNQENGIPKFVGFLNGAVVQGDEIVRTNEIFVDRKNF